jgi:hypothetical protein
VHLKEGQTSAFVVMKSADDVADAIRSKDWAKVGDRDVRLSMSNKTTF